MLWDRGEGAGYVQHITADPYPGTAGQARCCSHVAFGDHQVTELSALIEARTIGVHDPPPGRRRRSLGRGGARLGPRADRATRATARRSSSGTRAWTPIPFENLAPATVDDSHEDPRADADVRAQKASFLFDDTLIDVCDGEACTADHNP